MISIRNHASVSLVLPYSGNILDDLSIHIHHEKNLHHRFFEIIVTDPSNGP